MNAMLIFGIILILAGFVFIGIETVIPGFGAPGIAGICCIIAGISLAADSIVQAVIIGAVVLVLIGILVFILITLLSKGKLKSPLVLNESQDKEAGYISSGDLKYLIGKSGITTTDLRPAGKAQIEGVEFDVISEGKYISNNTKVEIYKISNSSLVVREK